MINLLKRNWERQRVNNMSKAAVLLIGVDLGFGKDHQCATLNLYYNEIHHIIYQTTDEEQVTALNKIMEGVMKERTKLENLEQIVQKDTYKIIDFSINHPEDFEPVYLNMWARNFYDKDYGYSIEDCCRCYNEDTHSNMPIEVFKEYVKLYSLLVNRS